MSTYFITGTDTGVGKTWATLALMKTLQNKGKIVVGMKPVASGCTNTDQGLRNDDALSLLQLSNEQGGKSLNYEMVNPYAFEQAVAPHIAAELLGKRIDIEKIAGHYDLLKKDSDCVLVEGVGGWCVPLGKDIMLSDMVNRLDLRVILVIGLRLGCINHALSTLAAIRADGARTHGWIVSHLDSDYACLDNTLDLFHSRINAPYLGCLPHMEKFDMDIAVSHVTI